MLLAAGRPLPMRTGQGPASAAVLTSASVAASAASSPWPPGPRPAAGRALPSGGDRQASRCWALRPGLLDLETYPEKRLGREPVSAHSPRVGSACPARNHVLFHMECR